MTLRPLRPLRGLFALPLLAPAATVTPLAAQDAPRVEASRPSPGAITITRGGTAPTRRMLGVSLAEGGSVRDTAGLLVTDVTRGGPAEQAGIGPGDRLVRIDGIDLRVEAADAGDAAAANARVARLRRTLDAAKDSQPVRLEVLQDGRRRTVQVVPQAQRGWTWRMTPPAAPGAPAAPGVMFFRGPEGPGGEAVELELRGLREAQRGLDEQRRILEREMPRLRAELRRDLRALPPEITVGPGRGGQRREVRMLVRGDRDGDRQVLIEQGGLALATVNKDLAASLGRGTDGGLLVLRVSDDYAPLKAGDVILKVDGAAVADRDVRLDLDRDRPHRVEVIRNGRTQVLELKPN